MARKAPKTWAHLAHHPGGSLLWGRGGGGTEGSRQRGGGVVSMMRGGGGVMSIGQIMGGVGGIREGLRVILMVVVVVV